MTDEDLELFFGRFGKILSCEIIRDKKTGDSLQYAFIEFENQKDCEQAYFKMDNVLIDDHRIHVDFSQSVSLSNSLNLLRLTMSRSRGFRIHGEQPQTQRDHDTGVALGASRAWRSGVNIEVTSTRSVTGAMAWSSIVEKCGIVTKDNTTTPPRDDQVAVEARNTRVGPRVLPHDIARGTRGSIGARIAGEIDDRLSRHECKLPTSHIGRALRDSRGSPTQSRLRSHRIRSQRQAADIGTFTAQ